MIIWSANYKKVINNIIMQRTGFVELCGGALFIGFLFCSLSASKLVKKKKACWNISIMEQKMSITEKYWHQQNISNRFKKFSDTVMVISIFQFQQL